METLLTSIFVDIDEWYQAHGQVWRDHKPEVRPRCTDSEILTWLLAQEYLPYTGETQFLGHIRANYGALFPTLPDQSQFNRHTKGPRERLELLRQARQKRLGAGQEMVLIMYTRPVPVMGHKCSKAHSDFADSASYGYCARRKLRYFGYKLLSRTTLSGIPVCRWVVHAPCCQNDQFYFNLTSQKPAWH